MKRINGKKLSSIVVVGRRWFSRPYGNTYHTSQIILNGTTVVKTPIEYGYGTAFVDTAKKWLIENKYVTLGEYDPIWSLRDKGVTFESIAVDVETKKEL